MKMKTTRIVEQQPKPIQEGRTKDNVKPFTGKGRQAPPPPKPFKTAETIKVVNELNEEKFFKYKEQHINDGGNSPDAFALTELIKESLLSKDYIIYKGGGPYDGNGNRFLRKYDVVLTFTWGNDPEFMVVMDDDGDYCELYCSDKNGKLLVKNY